MEPVAEELQIAGLVRFMFAGPERWKRAGKEDVVLAEVTGRTLDSRAKDLDFKNELKTVGDVVCLGQIGSLL